MEPGITTFLEIRVFVRRNITPKSFLSYLSSHTCSLISLSDYLADNIKFVFFIQYLPHFISSVVLQTTRDGIVKWLISAVKCLFRSSGGHGWPRNLGRDSGVHGLVVKSPERVPKTQKVISMTVFSF